MSARQHRTVQQDFADLCKNFKYISNLCIFTICWHAMCHFFFTFFSFSKKYFLNATLRTSIAFKMSVLERVEKVNFWKNQRLYNKIYIFSFLVIGKNKKGQNWLQLYCLVFWMYGLHQVPLSQWTKKDKKNIYIIIQGDIFLWFKEAFCQPFLKISFTGSWHFRAPT